METEVNKTGFVTPKFVKQREVFYAPRTGKVLLGCSDERELTDASGEVLASEYSDALDPRKGYASIFGGAAGIVKVAAVVGIAQYPNFLETVGGYDGLMGEFMRFTCNDTSEKAIVAALHTAQNSEAVAAQEAGENIDPSKTLSHGTGATGCAYGGGVGATSNLLGNNQDIQKVSRQTLTKVYGNDNFHDILTIANREFAAQVGADFSVGRADFLKLTNKESDNHLAIMVLAGRPHFAAKESGVMSNYDLDSVRNTTAAHKAGEDFYSQDVAIATELALRTFKKYRLNPELLMRAFEMDAVPVRAVLVSQDANAATRSTGLTALGMGVRGNWQDALARLKKIA